MENIKNKLIKKVSSDKIIYSEVVETTKEQSYSLEEINDVIADLEQNLSKFKELQSKFQSLLVAQEEPFVIVAKQ